MAKEATAPVHGGEPAPVTTLEPRKRRALAGPRKPAQPRDVYAIIEILDESGNVVPFSKSQVKLLGIEKDAKKVLELIDGTEHPNALYVHGKVAPGR